MLGRLGQIFLALSFIGKGAVSPACDATDFTSLDVTGHGPDLIASALELAYPDLSVDSDLNQVRFQDGTTLDMGHVSDRAAQDRLTSGSLREQFYYTYPLTFDLISRKTPFHDPGRIRNDAFFRKLYSSTERSARQNLDKVRLPDQNRPNFYMTRHNNVSCQMANALAEIAVQDLDIAPFFNKVGGSFNWRMVRGTNRLSAHSFGIAFDLNPSLGGYWKWSGAPEGQAFDYDNNIPQALVEIFEKYGFIWGGKWHHFDGMHFEYRPELILYARMAQRGL